MKKKVTIYDIAEKLKISPSTVSRALAGNSLINNGTREKVIAAAIETGYLNPKTLNKATTIAVVIPECENLFYQQVLAGLQNTLQDNFLVAVHYSFNSTKIEKEIVARLDTSRVFCLLISQSMDTTDSSHLAELQKKGVPVICFNRVHYQQPCPKFVMDNYMDAYQLTNHLVTSGFRRIGFAAKHFNCGIYKERIKAYRDVLNEHEIPFNPDFLIYSEQTIDDTHEVITRFLNLGERPDALILPNFTAALQAISIARLKHLSIPGELALVSFDDSPECKYTTPTITAIEYPCDEIGAEIGKFLLSLNRDQSYNRDTVKIFSSNLIIRGSSLVDRGDS